MQPRLSRVVKIGGRVQRDARLAQLLARLWMEATGSFCVVHGGGETISSLQARLGHESRFVAGRRITTGADIEVLRMALSGAANKQLVSYLSAEGIAAVGISGEDGSLIEARAIDAEQLGRVGLPVNVNARLLWALLDGGYLPVISPLARDSGSTQGDALNVNGDDAAVAIALAMHADELLLISDVPGVIIDGITAPMLSSDDAELTIETGIATSGMAMKLRAALDALRLGVPAVRIGGLDVLLDPTLGTTLLATPQLA